MFVTIQIVINRTIEGYVQFSLKIIYCLSTYPIEHIQEQHTIKTIQHYQEHNHLWRIDCSVHLQK
jgi:hypothetical protein